MTQTTTLDYQDVGLILYALESAAADFDRRAEWLDEQAEQELADDRRAQAQVCRDLMARLEGSRVTVTLRLEEQAS